ncbi:MAG: hypothetical protein ACLTAX_02030 [Waltera sp.]
MESDILYGTAYSGVSGIYDACGKETSFLFADRIVFGNIYRRNFCYNTIFGIPEGGIAYFIYWAVYIVVAALFCRNGLKVPVSEAVYCMIFAVGMQHIAFDMYIIFQIAWGESFAVPIIIFVIVYVLFYIFLARRLTHRGRFIVTRRSLFSMLTIVIVGLDAEHYE